MTRPPTDETAPGAYRYVITLLTSSMPMTVKVAPELAFPGISVFRSRTVEDGRERFRLHLGYFGSLAQAGEALAKVRQRYPTALIASAPAANIGSLDDTLNTRFTLVRGAVARLVTAEDRAPAGTEPPRAAAATPAPTLTPSEVASVMAPQRYAIQLEWSLAPIPPTSIPRLGIFRAYSLYAVSVLRQGSPEHGLRLGFFKNLDGARQVADYVRYRFPHASVVPVSYREYARASELTRPQAAPPRPSAGGGFEIVEHWDGPDAEARREPAAAPATGPAPPGTADTGGHRTRDELLALLGAHELEVDSAGDGRATATAEERIERSRRPQRNVRSW